MSYLLVVLVPSGTPPEVLALNALGGEYFFHPLAKGGRVWTLDDHVWRNASKESIQTIALFAAELDEIDKIAKEGPLLLGVVEKQMNRPVFGGGSNS